MADHFADQYWSTKFWTVNYFQGGEQATGAISGSAAGTSTATGTLTAAGILAGSAAGSATVTGTLTYTGTATLGRSKLHTPIFQNLYNPQAERQAALAQAIKREDEEILMAIKEFLKVAA